MGAFIHFVTIFSKIDAKPPHYIAAGGSHSHIFHGICKQHTIEPEWIPRAENEVVDYLSHIIDYDDWSLDHSIFMSLIISGGLIPSTDLPITTTHNYLDLTSNFGTQVQKQWMLLLVTGIMTTTGCVPQYTFIPRVI